MKTIGPSNLPAIQIKKVSLENCEEPQSLNNSIEEAQDQVKENPLPASLNYSVRSFQKKLEKNFQGLSGGLLSNLQGPLSIKNVAGNILGVSIEGKKNIHTLGKRQNGRGQEASDLAKTVNASLENLPLQISRRHNRNILGVSAEVKKNIYNTEKRQYGRGQEASDLAKTVNASLENLPLQISRRHKKSPNE